MKEDRRKARRDAIEAAAYALLEQDGYDGLSMQGLARAAKASNETLYRWYGDKTGLYEALVARNAETIRDRIQSLLEQGHDPIKTLGAAGPALLTMLLGRQAIALNRAAAADSSGVLGAALAKYGRGTVAPLFEQAVGNAINSGALRGASRDLTEFYLANLIGDLQVRRVTRAMPMPDLDLITDRADTALSRLVSLYGEAAAPSGAAIK